MALPPTMYSPQQGTDIFTNSAGAMTAAGGALGQTMGQGAIAHSMNTYLSPYRTQVIDDSVARMRDRRNIDMNMLQGDAQAAGAYGGSRHGIIESDLIDKYGRNEDEMVARLLQSGFDTSSNLALQELGLMQSGAGGLMQLAGQGFGMGQQIQANQNAVGTQQQQLLQAILAGAGQQFDSYMSSPEDAANKMASVVSGSPLAGNQTQTYKPGLFDYLSMGSNVYAAGK